MIAPLVSIIIPTYNRAHLIGVTLNSIINQSYIHWECLVIDDGSTDASEKIISEYIASDARISYHKRPINRLKGANACRNYGFELCSGEYVNWFDSDDIMLPDKLKLQIENLTQNLESPYCICQSLWYDKENKKSLGLRSLQITSENRFEDYILQKNIWLTTAPLWRKQFIENNNLFFDETLHQSQEYDFHIKALFINDNYTVINEPLVNIIKHKEAMSNSLYNCQLKVFSNLKVKGEILKNYKSHISEKAKFKIFEAETLMFKDLLVLHKMSLAFTVLKIQLKHLKFLDIKYYKRAKYRLKLILIFMVYLIFGKGYNIVKPLKQD